MLSKMYPHLYRAKIKHKQLVDLENRLLMMYPEVREIFNRMFARIWLYEYREVEEIWTLLAPEVWEKYDAMALDLREQRLLAAALKNLYKAFRKVLTYGEVNLEEETDSEPQ